MESLYEQDALAWSERQAGLLRRLEAGERVNAELDWPNLIEEIEAMGTSELRACESNQEQALIHLMKLSMNPESPAARDWRSEIVGFVLSTQRAYSPSMRQRLSWADIVAYAQRKLAAGLSKDEALPDVSRLRLAHLLDAEPDVDALVALISSH